MENEGDDFDLPVEGENVCHGSNPCSGDWTDRRWRGSEKVAIFLKVVIATGSNPEGVIWGRRGCCRAGPD